MDNLCLNALVREIRPHLLHQSVQKIQFSADRILVLSLRSRFLPCLVIKFVPPTPLLFLSSQDIPIQSSPSEFLMLLKKNVQGGRIVEFHKDPADRLVILGLEKRTLSNQIHRFRLLIRLIPHKLNLLLLNDQGQVMVSVNPLGHNEKSGPWRYEATTSTGKYRFDSVTYDQFCGLFAGFPESSEFAIHRGFENPPLVIRPIGLEKLKLLSGLSPVFMQELEYKGCKTIQSLWNEYQQLLGRFQKEPCSPRIYFRSSSSRSSESPQEAGTLSSQERVLSPIPLQHLEHVPHQVYPTMNDLAADLFRSSFKKAVERNEEQNLKTQLTTSLKKMLRLKRGLNEDLCKNLERSVFRKYSDLLFTQPNKTERGKRLVRVSDLFDATLGECDIPLDPQLNLIQNANRYARLFQKSNRAIPFIRERLERVESEISNLQTQLDRLLKPAENRREPDRDAVHPNETEIPRQTAKNSEAQASSESQLASSAKTSLIKKSARIFVSTEGWEIWVGRNGRENDFLTFKLAKPNDFWFHVAEYGGSHVVLRNMEGRSAAPKQSILEAAQLAAYFSQARNAGKVEVHFTQRKNVSKPKGAKPGMVRLKEHKTITVHPSCEAKAKRILPKFS